MVKSTLTKSIENKIKYNLIKLNKNILNIDRMKELLEEQKYLELDDYLFKNLDIEEEYIRIHEILFPDIKKIEAELLFNPILANSETHLEELVNRIKYNQVDINSLKNEILVYLIKFYKNNSDKKQEEKIKNKLYMKNYDYFHNLAKRNASTYFIRNLEYDELVQEAYFGFERAIIDFNGFKKVTFKNFAKYVIKMRYITLLNESKTKKNGGNSINYISLNDTYESDEGEYGRTQEEWLFEEINDNPFNEKYIEKTPDEIYEEKELIESILDISSELERNALKLRMEGYNYEEIAEKLGMTRKQVDNALYRLTKKARNLAERNIF